MKCFVSSVCVLSVLVAATLAAPLTSSTSLQVGASTGVSTGGNGGAGGLTSILSSIDLPGLLRGVNSFVKLVGVFCPPLSQVLDNVIQNVTSTAFRVFGRAILRGGGLGGGSSSGGSGGGQKVNVVLPTFPPDDYEDEDEESEDESSSSTTAVPDAVPEGLSRDTEDISSTENSIPPYTSASSDDESNNIAKRHVRVIREAEEVAEEDQEGAESAPHPGHDLSNVEIDDQDRDKRYLPFGGSVEGHAGGGSGNFLFDIIRNTADRAARTVGTVYRMVAGTENLGWGLSATKDDGQTHTLATAASHVTPAKLVAGSGATEESDEKEHAPGGVAEVDIAKSADGYTEGIPGPITRLFVIANRGLANLVQDLILRLAQTSEKLVNFKARLITSLI